MTSPYEFSSSLEKRTKWHGNHNENEHRTRLSAGRLSMIYENGSLRYISYGKLELIRMIYSAVRDKEWVTIVPELSDEKIYIIPGSFRISYNCRYKSAEIDFYARYTIEGKSDNTLTFNFEGEALNTFEKNRIGFCVLHPINGYAGEDCIITHPGNNTETLKFPVYIAPHQPFLNISSMRWKASDCECSLTFYGDIFETEDQRNWTDASYKTYCTPLSQPFPAKITKGEKISQTIELKLEGDLIPVKVRNDQIVISIYPDLISDLPEIGIGRSTRPEPITEGEIEILKKLNFDHYRADICLFKHDWEKMADITAFEARKLGYKLEIALLVDDDSMKQVLMFSTWLEKNHDDITVIHIYRKSGHTVTDQLTDMIAPLLKNACHGIRIGSGTNANFAQLNRNRPDSVYNDHICYSIHPQEHRTDNTTMVENLQAQGYTVHNSAKFADARDIWISPVNLKRRFNANRGNYEQLSDYKEFPPQADSRLMSLFGACWSAVSLKYISEAGTSGVTYFETAGERGILQGDYDSRWPDKFPSVKGMIFPLFHVFNYILRHKSLKVIKSVCSHPLTADILSLTDGHVIKIILVNFAQSHENVKIRGYKGEFSLKQLNSESFPDAVGDPDWIDHAPAVPVRMDDKILLEPFSVSFIEGRV